MADPAPSEDPAPGSNEAQAKDGAPAVASKVDDTTFANTKQHVADKHDGGKTERFANTKLNIALINDPKNGPRFTMTKRESGLSDRGDDDRGSDPAEKDAPAQVAEAASTTSERADAKETARSELSAAISGAAASQNRDPAPRADDVQQADVAESTVQPGDSAKPAASLRPPPPAVEPQGNIPIDSSKTFVGPNGTYYDESWRWMDWRGTRQSWNWPAALSFGHWFAYRRLYSFAGLYLLLLTGLTAATVNDVPVLGILIATLLVLGLTGLYGNILYFRAFRRAVDHVTKNGEGSYQELQGQLARAGGTSILSLSVMGALSIAGIAAAIGLTHYLRGGIAFNFWPF